MIIRIASLPKMYACPTAISPPSSEATIREAIQRQQDNEESAHNSHSEITAAGRVRTNATAADEARRERALTRDDVDARVVCQDTHDGEQGAKNHVENHPQEKRVPLVGRRARKGGEHWPNNNACTVT